MGPSSRIGRRPRLGLLLRAGAPLIAAGSAAALLSGGGSSARASIASAPSYSALESTAASGLPVAEPTDRHRPGDPVGPSFPAQPPDGATGWPVAGSIRRLSLSEPGLSAWIARGADGGVCVLLYDGRPVDGVSAIDMACSPPEGLSRGASVEVAEIPGMTGKTVAAGVVPDGVTSVREVMADGSTATSAVHGNAWARIADEPAAAGEQPTESREG
jgi:hypothetical protein